MGGFTGGDLKTQNFAKKPKKQKKTKGAGGRGEKE